MRTWQIATLVIMCWSGLDLQHVRFRLSTAGRHGKYMVTVALSRGKHDDVNSGPL